MFRVLLVDDEVLALTVLRHALPWKEYGFTDIRSVTSSLEALELLEKEHFDACFVDICMPHLTGLELVEKAKDFTPETFFVIVSGYSDFSYAKKAIQQGVLDYCLKPVVTEECIPLIEKLTQAVYKSHLQQDPKLGHLILKDEAACRRFLFALPGFSDTPAEASITLLLIRSAHLWDVMKEIDMHFPARILFLSETEGCLIWNQLDNTSALFELLEDYAAASLLLFDTVPTKTSSFQSSLKRLQVACHSEASGLTGIMKLANVQEENAAYFTTVLHYIDENYANQLTLQMLAHEFGMNYSYLSQMFKKTIGISFVEYLTDLRLKHACKLLTDTFMPIINISEAVGFNDYHYFCNTFKKYYNKTPSQYRDSQKGV